MAFFDKPLEELRGYKPEVREPADFDAFWASTLEDARRYPLNARFERVKTPLKLVESYDVTFNGYGGQPIRAWFTLPTGTSEPLPCVVEYLGYGGGRGLPVDHLLHANAGYAHLIMDTRGQGSAWRRGDTGDLPDGANPSVPGFMTQGIMDPHTYYYRRLFTDCVRAIETARSHELVDAARIVVTGGSQGGGMSIAAAALMPDVSALMPDVPFLCQFERAIQLVNTQPYAEITRFLSNHREKAETVLNTLSYFDGVNFAKRITAPALYSVALMDMTCPPSTVFASYNHLKSAQRHIEVYSYNDHEGGGMDHELKQLEYLAELWASA